LTTALKQNNTTKNNRFFRCFIGGRLSSTEWALI
jgi:hypothetical protein